MIFDCFDPAGSRAALVKPLEADRVRLLLSIGVALKSVRQKIEALFDQSVGDKLARFDERAAEARRIGEQCGHAQACRDEDDALETSAALSSRICAWRCASLDDVRIKCGYLLECADLGDEEREALLRSLAGGIPAVQG